MANIKIAQLTNKTTLSDTDIVIVESATATEKMTVAKLRELLQIPWENVAGRPSVIPRTYYNSFITAGTTFSFGVIETGLYILSSYRYSAGSAVWIVIQSDVKSVLKLHGVGQQGTPFFDGSLLKFTAHGGGGEGVSLYKLT